MNLPRPRGYGFQIPVNGRVEDLPRRGKHVTKAEISSLTLTIRNPLLKTSSLMSSCPSMGNPSVPFLVSSRTHLWPGDGNESGRPSVAHLAAAGHAVPESHH